MEGEGGGGMVRVLFWKDHLAELQTRVDEPVVQQEVWKRPGPGEQQWA